MVKIPELAEDGQNWKIYHAKFLEVTATFNCLEVLAGRPYEGDNWDGCNALLCCTFMESVTPSIYFKIHCRTAYENFKYLAKRFHNNDPIPCANELQRTGTATAAEMPDNCPTSTDAATEWHAHAEWNTEDLSTTEDVDNGNVRRMEDPRTSFKALAQGTSTKCAETTTVILKSMLHEMQDQLQNSLQTTPRLPTEGELSKCRQEAVDSIVTATCTNSTAKPTKMVADVNRTAPLDGEPAETACGVDEGDEMECEPQMPLPKAEFYCKEQHKHSRNTMEDLPSTHGLLLEGEWCQDWVSSGLTRGSRGSGY